MPVDSVPIYSAYGDDPDLGELVELFVEETPERVETLEQLFQHGAADELCRAAHQLKGAAGSYGFGDLTPLAAAVESSVREGDPEESIQRALEELIDACRRVRAGAAS